MVINLSYVLFYLGNPKSKAPKTAVDRSIAVVSLETLHTHYGYARLRVDQMEGPYGGMIQSNGPIQYLSSTKYRQAYKAAGQGGVSTEDLTDDQGPAVQSTVSDEEVPIFLMTGKVTLTPLLQNTDIVPALHCITWPKIAEEWMTRRRPSGWPPAKLIASIVKGGCHLVPIGHRKSPKYDIEWRLSFSEAEKLLAWSLTDMQRKCFIIFKYLFFYSHLKVPPVLCSFYFKMLFYTVLEKIPSNTWVNTHLGSCILRLLDELIYCLAKRNLPNYFVPKNNLLDHVSTDSLDIILNKAVHLRHQPIHFIMNFDLALKPKLLTKDMLQEMFDPLLSVVPIDVTADHETLHEAYLSSALKLCEYYHHETGFTDVGVDVLIRLYDFQSQAHIKDHISLPMFLSKLICTRASKYIEDVHQMHKIVLDKCKDHCDLHYVHCNLANAFYGLARQLEIEGSTRTPGGSLPNHLLAGADRHYKKAIDLNPKDLDIRMYYATYLRHIDCLEDAAHEFSIALTLPKNKHHEILYRYPYHTLDSIYPEGYNKEPLKCYVYYSLVRCLLELGQESEARQLYRSFGDYFRTSSRVLSKEEKNMEKMVALTMLGHASMLLGHFTKAEKYLERAIRYVELGSFPKAEEYLSECRKYLSEHDAVPSEPPSPIVPSGPYGDSGPFAPSEISEPSTPTEGSFPPVPSQEQI